MLQGTLVVRSCSLLTCVKWRQPGRYQPNVAVWTLLLDCRPAANVSRCADAGGEAAAFCAQAAPVRLHVRLHKSNCSRAGEGDEAADAAGACGLCQLGHGQVHGAGALGGPQIQGALLADAAGCTGKARQPAQNLWLGSLVSMPQFALRATHNKQEAMGSPGLLCLE